MAKLANKYLYYKYNNYECCIRLYESKPIARSIQSPKTITVKNGGVNYYTVASIATEGYNCSSTAGYLNRCTGPSHLWYKANGDTLNSIVYNGVYCDDIERESYSFQYTCDGIVDGNKDCVKATFIPGFRSRCYAHTGYQTEIMSDYYLIICGYSTSGIKEFCVLSRNIVQACALYGFDSYYSYIAIPGYDPTNKSKRCRISLHNMPLTYNGDYDFYNPFTGFSLCKGIKESVYNTVEDW